MVRPQDEALAEVREKLDRLASGPDLLESIASAVGVSAADLRAALVWVVQERRKARG